MWLCRCLLSPVQPEYFLHKLCHRSPSHPLLTPYISHMGLGGRAKWEAPLNSVPRIPNHSSCEVGELTQTGEPALTPVKAARPRAVLTRLCCPQVWCSTSTTGSSSARPTGTTAFSLLIGRPTRWGWRPPAGAAPSRAGWPFSTASCRTSTGGG